MEDWAFCMWAGAKHKIGSYPDMPSEDESIRMYRFIHEIPSCCPDPAYRSYLGKLLKAMPPGPALTSKTDLTSWVGQVSDMIADHHGKPRRPLDLTTPPRRPDTAPLTTARPPVYLAVALAAFALAGLFAVQDGRA